jgi:small multidrug resistance family-3 protein
VISNLFVFTIAATLEIGGCFAFWRWLQRGASPLVAVLGVGSLVGFAAVLTRSDAAFAGRAYAAYGGIYVAASIAWLWIIEGQRPTSGDIIGASIAIAGTIVILLTAAHPSR